MAGIKGKITRAVGGKQKTVYLSDAFGIWIEGENIKITNQRGNQEFHSYISPADGEIYNLLKALYEYGINLPSKKERNPSGMMKLFRGSKK